MQLRSDLVLCDVGIEMTIPAIKFTGSRSECVYNKTQSKFVFAIGT